MPEKPKKTITIETAHSYALRAEHRSERFKNEVSLADKLATKLKANNIKANLIILLDETEQEVKAKASTDNHWRWRLFIQRDYEEISKTTGLSPQAIILESSFIEAGNKLIKLLKTAVDNSKKFRLNKNRNKIIYGSGKNRSSIKLTTDYEVFVQQSEKRTIPSCEVLDMSVYEQKLKNANIAITILPVSFYQQQERVRTLFMILGNSEPNIIVIYTNKDGSISKIDTWNESLKDIVSLLQS